MSKEQILENNKLIAQWMCYWSVEDNNWVFISPRTGQGIIWNKEVIKNSEGNLSYNSSWAYIMTVIEKISNIKHWSVNSTIEWLNEKYEFDGFYCVEDLFRAVILYIKDKDETN